MKTHSTLLDRVDWVRRHLAGGLDWKPFALATGVRPSTFNVWRTRVKRDPSTGLSLATLQAIHARWRVPLEWLASGTGQAPDAQIDELEAALAQHDWPAEVVACARAKRETGAGPYTLRQWLSWLHRVAEACDGLPESNTGIRSIK